MGATTKGLAEMLGVTTQTVRLWIRNDRVSYHTGPSGRAFFTDDDISKIIREQSDDIEIWAHYARSSCGSADALNNQLDLLAKEYGEPQFAIRDRGSGLNEKRTGLNRILDMARCGKITDLAVTSQDRITRFGFHYIKRYLDDYGVTVHILHGASEKHPEQELIDDFMALLASFSGRYYHLRNKANQLKFIEQIQRETIRNDGEKQD